MTRSTVLLPLSLAALLAASPALAQTATGGDWSFEIGTGTDNRSKNASKSGNDGYAFGSATWESGDGLFYAGPAFQTIQSGGSNLEAELVAGYQPEAFGYQFDFSLAYKNRLDADPGYDAETVELTADISRSIGPARAGLQLQYAPQAAGSTESFTWVEGEVGWAFSDRIDASVAVGRREQDNGPDYTGWNAGVTLAMTDAIALDLRYYDTSAHADGEQYEDALVAKVAYAF
ncbi:TorF family putative porin [Brevundimonas sp.]|jgi:uncharacterized protein (TIGR02001 family)|uniref:TorF family putative porin n=1 Tax=Brevundimonas sp. TaxID=1871086 RepID=UPI0037BF78E9